MGPMRSLYYLALLSMFGLTVSLTVTPSFLSAKNQFAFAQPTAIDANGKRPNILLIMGDDFGYSDIGSFGSEISTPNLDSLAKDGMILTNYHTNPTCSPARVAALTGVDHHIGGIGTMDEVRAENQVGKPGYEGYINERVVTVAELLRDAGYQTYHSGKWHLSGDENIKGTFPHDRGFEHALTLLAGAANHYNGFPEPPVGNIEFAENSTITPRPGNNTLYSNDLYTNKMIEFIENKTDGNPFFGYLAFQVAHSPFQAPQETVSKYDNLYKVGWDKIRNQIFEKQKQLGFWDADMKLSERVPPNVPWDSLTPEQQAYASRVLAVRAAMIENMDQNIGKLIQVLKKNGQYDNTLIIFTSDNGSSEPKPLLGIKFDTANEAGTRDYIKQVNNTLSNIGNVSSIINYAGWGPYSSVTPLSGYKVTEYEGGVRAPFVVKEPVSMSQTNANSNATSNPKVVKGFTYVTDITPTILEYAGVQHPGSSYNGHEVHPMMGKSLKPLLNGTSDRVYSETDIVVDEMFNNSAVWSGDWKAMRHQPPIGNGEWQLYNLVDDPAEVVNLADKHPDILQRLTSAYDKYATDVGVVIPRGEKYFNAISSAAPPVNKTQTIHSADIAPEQFSNVID